MTDVFHFLFSKPMTIYKNLYTITWSLLMSPSKVVKYVDCCLTSSEYCDENTERDNLKYN